MRRLPTLAAVLLALGGVLTGNLYRPCHCNAAEARGLEGRCCGRTAAADLPPCCRTTHPDRRAPEHDGCRICCKPRPPLGEPDASPATDAPAAPTLDAATDVVAVLAEVEGPTAPPVEVARRTIDPWLLSPEGLAVFLI